jgi:predicted nucleic acid-binding Zn ribbon protein
LDYKTLDVRQFATVETVSQRGDNLRMGEAVEATKRCIACAESINAKAIRCPTCGSGQPGDGVTEPPCEKCGGAIVATSHQRRSGGITFLGVMLIIGGFFGLPLFGIGVFGILTGILLLALVKNKKFDIIRCIRCGHSRPHRLAPFYKP